MFESVSKDKRLKKLKKRKLFKVKNLIYYTMEKGSDFEETINELKFDLTAEDIKNESWRNNKDFKAMNLFSKGKVISNGGLHPLMKLRSEFRKTLLEMGF